MMRLMVSFVGAVLIYAGWYWIHFGQVCPAMWFGTAPPIIMLIAGKVIWDVWGYITQ